MGGGADSRIPARLQELLPPSEVRVVVRTYDFDPELGHAQILSWVQAEKPQLLIGESLGALQALRIQGLPHLFVSPSLGASALLVKAAPIASFALGRWYLHRKYPDRPGDRQALRFYPDILRKYQAHGEAALAAIESDGYYYAFFGKNDHYKASGVVSLELWEKYFGKTYTEYDGTHFMEEEYLSSLLVPKIREVLALEK